MYERSPRNDMSQRSMHCTRLLGGKLNFQRTSTEGLKKRKSKPRSPVTASTPVPHLAPRGNPQVPIPNRCPHPNHPTHRHLDPVSAAAVQRKCLKTHHHHRQMTVRSSNLTQEKGNRRIPGGRPLMVNCLTFRVSPPIRFQRRWRVHVICPGTRHRASAPLRNHPVYATHAARSTPLVHPQEPHPHYRCYHLLPVGQLQGKHAGGLAGHSKTKADGVSTVLIRDQTPQTFDKLRNGSKAYQ